VPDLLTINTLRVLAAEAVQKANSGHPGMPLGAAPMAYTLWAKHLRHNPQNPGWVDRDRFVLSAGHGSALLYSLLHLFGYGVTMEDLKAFRQWESKTPGHPEYLHTGGVETTTGPLGQGFANGVGMAMAEAHLAATFNRPGHEIFSHSTYVLVGDGDLMEGVAAEAASLAGTLGLGKLMVLYDSNSITIEGDTNLAFREDVGSRFKAYGWQVLKVEDGNDLEAISSAIQTAKDETGKPAFIEVKTKIGFGSAKQGLASAHGEPLGEDHMAALKENLGFKDLDPFTVPEEVVTHMKSLQAQLSQHEEEWLGRWHAYEKAYPELALAWQSWQREEIEVEGLKEEEFWSFTDKPDATRNSSGDILNKIASFVPNLFGGSADLAPSNKSEIKGRGSFSPEDYTGSNLHFGVREHAMGAIANGIAVHGGLIPYVATFLIFSDYMKPAMRLAALMGLPVIYILTHDSIGVGEDGPTHQPVEQLAAIRSIPNFIDFRPADFKETAAGWHTALTSKNSPIALVLTRQNVPQFKETGKEALKGAYILLDAKKDLPDLILLASGSEVQLVYEAHAKLQEKGIDARVVSMPSMKLFERQPAEYREKVLPAAVKTRLAVEAAASMGWHKYVGLDGAVVAMDTFGASAPGNVLFKNLGFTVENVVDHALALLAKAQHRSV
jgi:transketolase